MCLITSYAVIAAFLADWASGFIHWFFDTWGTIDTHFPLFGNVSFNNHSYGVTAQYNVIAYNK